MIAKIDKDGNLTIEPVNDREAERLAEWMVRYECDESDIRYFIPAWHLQAAGDRWAGRVQ